MAQAVNNSLEILDNVDSEMVSVYLAFLNILP